MTREHQLREAAARCLTVLHRYHDGERTAAARERMGLEVGLIIGWLLELGLPPGATEDRVLGPIEAELLARFGHETGRKLNGEFVEAFESEGMGLLYRYQGSETGHFAGNRGRGA